MAVNLEHHLAVRRALDEVSETLVEMAQKAIDETRPDRGLKASQLSNLITVAGETSSILVITNFLRYQMGRQGGQVWRGLGDRVISDLEKLPAKADAFLQDLPEEERRHFPIRLARQYLGFLRRYYMWWSKQQQAEGGPHQGRPDPGRSGRPAPPAQPRAEGGPRRDRR
ncbi:MAG TPA: hypothetical protein VNO81_03815 [Candidatus Nitrosotenuis sp.]|jgi:hypothetical protein|nr:hypothetical protein [Candidatus Nitrosotenuis sp.]